jgi:hypothetical protein
MKSIVKFYLSGFYKQPQGLKKPYNPVLGECYRTYWFDPHTNTKTYYIAEQISHHPPITSFYVTNRKAGFCIYGTILAKSKFYGNSVSAILEGNAKIILLNRNEEYKLTFPYANCKGLFIGKMTMELGGKSANIILNDADLTIAVDGALYAFLYHSGQACDSGTRLLIQEEIYAAFMEKFLVRIKEVKVGPTTDASAGMGPVVSEKQMNTILAFIEKTKAEEGKLLIGGKRMTEGQFAKGFFIEPTAFEITPKHTIFHEEIFGPVVGITKFKTVQEAIALANNSKYGLAGAVWSQDKNLAHKIASQLEAGTVWINEYHLLNPGMPFGGFKQSGLGREMGPEGIMSYLEVRHVWESDCNERDKKVWLDAIF